MKKRLLLLLTIICLCSCEYIETNPIIGCWEQEFKAFGVPTGETNTLYFEDDNLAIFDVVQSTDTIIWEYKLIYDDTNTLKEIEWTMPNGKTDTNEIKLYDDKFILDKKTIWYKCE